jgi:hypothetical protein
VPYKVACRIRDFVTFSVKIAGRAPDLDLDDSSRDQLDQIEKERLMFKTQQSQGKSLLEGKSASSIPNDSKTFECSIDFEEVSVLKAHKIKQLELILKEAIDQKYKISFLKGMQLAYENLILFLLVVSVVLKANIFSLVYLLFIFKFLMSRSKTHLLVKMVTYIGVCFVLQYALFLFNLTSAISPAPFPP